MSDKIENLILEHLKKFQVSQDRIESELKEIKNRLAHLEIGQGTIMQHIGHQASMSAQQQLSHDKLSDRVDRIEKRLELNL